MNDLGQALAEANQAGNAVRMLGGGQPAHIPAIDAIWRNRINEIADAPGQLEQVLSHYEPPVGNFAFRQAIAGLLADKFGWPIGVDNIAITAGGQTAFFYLFNSLAGRFSSGQQKHVLLPLTPEYFGYAGQSVGGELFRGVVPKIETTGDHEFKYRVDFDKLKIDSGTAAICVSRPTNPTGNVLTDDEIHRLSDLAAQHSIPLLIDNAYGAPFPNVIFTDATPIWNENIILTLSLSKLGLPGTRTGIVVAPAPVIDWIASMTSVVGLSNANIGQAIMRPLIESGQILDLCHEIIEPFYRKKSQQAQAFAAEFFDDSLPYRIHRSEGALFLWLWLDELPITSNDLYGRLKNRGVLVVPGHHFFFGLDEQMSNWTHRDQCLRITFTMPEQDVREGFRILGEEIKRAYSGS